MFDPTIQQEVRDRTADVEERLTSKTTEPETAAAYQALWIAWIQITGTLMGFGLTHRDLCDASALIGEVAEEYAQGRTTS